MIDVSQLEFTYAGASSPVIRGLGFGVAEGEIFGFLGPSGAGKSTTQKILIGLLTGFEGSVSVLGKDLRAWEPNDYERIGVSFELPNHYLKLTAVENLRYFAALYRRKAREPGEVLEWLGLGKDGETRVGEFSKGMKTRLGVARALQHDPDLLFLDEPTAGLDPVSARAIRDLIRGQREAGKTVFLTTHDMMVADELCDRVALIVEGRIEAIDSPRALKLAHGERVVRVEHRLRGEGPLLTDDFPIAGLGGNAAFRGLLDESSIETIHTREASLEDVFVQLTGKSLLTGRSLS